MWQDGLDVNAIRVVGRCVVNEVGCEMRDKNGRFMLFVFHYHFANGPHADYRARFATLEVAMSEAAQVHLPGGDQWLIVDLEQPGFTVVARGGF